MPSGHCQLGGRFRRCRNSAEHVCQYCARDFCEEHARHVEGYEAVCTRKRCVLKHEDLQRHNVYKVDVIRRNKTGHCGEPECEEVHPRFQCSLCQGFYCFDHVTERSYPLQDGWVKIDKQVSVCEWCWARRKIWQRR
jgi:hypothetical protein